MPLMPSQKIINRKEINYGYLCTCREAPLIYKDKTHPRFMELYHLWRAQLTTDEPCKQFPNFVRAVLASEKREEG